MLVFCGLTIYLLRFFLLITVDLLRINYVTNMSLDPYYGWLNSYSAGFL